MRLLLSGKLRIVPTRRRLRVNIVPVDHVADVNCRLLFDPAAEGLTFHLTTPTDQLPTAGEVVAFTRRWARENLGVRLPRPIFLPIGQRVAGRTGRLLAPYLREQRRFLRVARIGRSVQPSRTGTTTSRSCWRTRPPTGSCIAPIAPSTSRSCSD